MSVAAEWPSRAAAGAAQVDQHIDEGGHDHAAQRGDAGQHDARGAAQLAVQHFTLDLQADQQEEHGHQAVVDPVQHGFLEDDGAQAEAELGAQRVEVGWRDPAVGDEQRQQGGEHQDVAAEGFGFQERLQERGGPRGRRAGWLTWTPLLPFGECAANGDGEGWRLHAVVRVEDGLPGGSAAWAGGSRKVPGSLAKLTWRGGRRECAWSGGTAREASGAGRTGCARSRIAGARKLNST